MVELTSAKIAKYFEDGKITYAEAVALVVDARSYVASTNSAYPSFLSAYAAQAEHAWSGGPAALAATADAIAVRLVLAQRLEAVGFDSETAKAQASAIGDLWNSYLSAGSDAQRRAYYDTHGLSVGVRASAAPAPPPTAVTRWTADPVAVELSGPIEGQMVIRSAFDGGISGEKSRTLVYNARNFVKKPVASEKADIQQALASYLSAHGFPMASAIQLGQLIEAAWRPFNERGTATFVDVSAVKISGLRSPTTTGGGANRWVAKPAAVTLSGSSQGQGVIGGCFKPGTISGAGTRTLVLYARRFAKLPDDASESAKVVPALRAYFEAHGFGPAAAADVAEIVDAAWHAANEKGQSVEVDVSAIRFAAAGGAVSVADLQERYRNIDARLAKLRDRVKAITPSTPVEAAQARSAELQAALTGTPSGTGGDALASQAVMTASAAALLDGVERVLAGLETYRAYATTMEEPTRKAYLGAIDRVYAAYVASVAKVFDTQGGPAAFASADSQAAALPEALRKTDDAHAGSNSPGGSPYESRRGSALASPPPGGHGNALPTTGTGAVENLVAQSTSRGGSSDDALPTGRVDYRGATFKESADGGEMEIDRGGRHVQITVSGGKRTIRVTGGGKPPLVVVIDGTGSASYYIRSLYISHYDEGGFRALRMNAQGQLTHAGWPILDMHLVTYESLVKAGLNEPLITVLLTSAFGKGVRGLGDARLNWAMLALQNLGGYLTALRDGGQPAFPPLQAFQVLLTVVSSAPHGQPEEPGYYRHTVKALRTKLGPVTSPNATEIARLRGLLNRSDDARDLALRVFLSDTSVGGEGAEALAQDLSILSGSTADIDGLILAFQRNPGSPQAYQAIRKWYENVAFLLEEEQQRYEAQAAGRGKDKAALLAKMVQQVQARKDGADPTRTAALDMEAESLSNPLVRTGSQKVSDDATDLWLTHTNLTKILRRLEAVAVPVAEHGSAVERARQLALKDGAQIYLVLDRGFDDKGAQQGYLVTAMPPTVEDRRVVLADTLTPQTVAKGAEVTFDNLTFKVADMANGKVLLVRDQNLYGFLAQAVTQGEGSMVEVVMGAEALARARRDWPSDAGAFPSGDSRDGVTVFHKSMLDPAFGKDASKPLEWRERDALLIHMYEKIRGSVGRRYQGAIDKFAGWESDPARLAKELVQIGQQLGFNNTWLELQHLFRYDWTVTQDSALPVLNLIMMAVNADSPGERARLTTQMPSEEPFKSLVGRIASQVTSLRNAKHDVETPKMVPATHDDMGNVIVPEYQDATQLFSIIESMPAMRDELFRLIGLGFDPAKPITADTFCRNAAERAYRDAFLDHQWNEKVASLVTGGLILVGTIVATAITGGVAGTFWAVLVGTGIAAVQAGFDIAGAEGRVDRTQANLWAGLDSSESLTAAQRDARWAWVMGTLNVASAPLLAAVNGGARPRGCEAFSSTRPLVPAWPRSTGGPGTGLRAMLRSPSPSRPFSGRRVPSWVARPMPPLRGGTAQD